MNSTLQCLAHTPPLRHYFLSGQYKNDLNVDNPLGTGGELAKEFANLLREMWLEEQPMPSDEEEGSSSTMVVGDDDPKDVSSSLTNGGENGIYSTSRKYSYGNGGSMHYSNNTTSSYGGGSDVTYPRSFKTTLGKHASRFVGYDQHDSQELAIYLLDALHEDMNRIRKKPYVEKPEQGEEESDVEAAAKAWLAHKQREDSAIQENFMGLIKSRLVCPQEECGRVSTTFDPCMYMSVPIPGSTDRQMKITFVPLPVKGGHTTGADMIIKICKNSTLKDLRARVAERAREAYNFTGEGLKDEDVQFTDVFNNKVSGGWRDVCICIFDFCWIPLSNLQFFTRYFSYRFGPFSITWTLLLTKSRRKMLPMRIKCSHWIRLRRRLWHTRRRRRRENKRRSKSPLPKKATAVTMI